MKMCGNVIAGFIKWGVGFIIKIGTSGYSYKDWIGPFYPEKTNTKDMLSIYSKEFDFTEINSSYYSLPNSYMMYHLSRKTHEGFMFSVKLHQSITHSRDADKDIYKKFLDALKPLEESNQLACLIAQFPYSFHLSRENIEYIRRMRDYLQGYDCCVEFRNNKWVCQAAFDLLKELNLSFVCVDEPDIKGLLEPLVVATANIGYIRFHGRNKEKWYNHRKAYERYDYCYSEAELKEWVPRVNNLSKKTDRLYIAFNNHFRAQAVLNARTFKSLLGVV